MPKMSSEGYRIIRRVVEKLTSGRWFLAVAAGYGFLELVRTQKVTPELALAYIMLVANWFFQKDRTPPPNETV